MDLKRFIRFRGKKNEQIILDLTKLKMVVISKDENEVRFIHEDNRETVLIGSGNAQTVLKLLGFEGLELPFLDESIQDCI